MFPRLPTSIFITQQNRAVSGRVVSSMGAKCSRRFVRIKLRGPNKINNRHPEAGTADRLLYSSFLFDIRANPIYNQRFFVWQQYGDFMPWNAQTGQPQPEPDEAGLDYWTRNITGNCFNVNTLNILAHVNDNNSCTEGWRANTSLAFWVDSSSPQGSHPGWLSSSGALVGVND